MIKKLLSFYFLLFISFISFSQEAYYNGFDTSLTGLALKNALTTKITATHTNKLTYTPGVWNASKITDLNPNNTTQVILIYGWENGSDGDDTNDKFRDKTLQDTGSGTSFVWNREHVFSKSLANPTFTTDQPGPGTDAHNLRPADRERNSLRSNKKFANGSGNSGVVNSNFWYPGDEWKGDVARMMMYMYVRYGTQCLPTGVGVGSKEFTPDEMIDLFLQWNVEDPVSDLEKVRNTYHEDTTNNADAQGNRNPFIDNPYLATRIWGGDSAQDLWGIYTSSDTEAPTVPTNVVASNETITTIDLSWTASTDNVAVTGYNVYIDGTLTYQTANTTYQVTGLSPSTSYAIQIEAKDLINNKSAKSTVLNASTTTDSNAPTVPTNLVASNISGTTFNLTWAASTDDAAVTGYDIFIDGSYNSSSSAAVKTISGLSETTSYSVTVLAKDAADNKSAQSTAINVTTTSGSISDLLISEYVEPAGGFNKAIEIVNLTGATINLAGYDLRRDRSGAGTWSSPFYLDGGSTKSIAPGDVFVVTHSSSDNSHLGVHSDLQNDPSVDQGDPLNFNGDDPVGLFKNNVLIDIVGVFNGNAGNFAKDVTLRRKAAILTPNTTFNYDPTGTTGEWDVLTENTFDGIGAHTSTLAVEKFDNTAFNMFPNPLTGNYLNLTQVNGQNITVLKIYSTTGQEVISIQNPDKTINLNGLKNGIYILKFYSENKIGIKKLIKQ
mgnify:CR=1 FL=1